MHCRRGVYFYTTFVFAVALALFPNWRNDGSAMRNTKFFPLNFASAVVVVLAVAATPVFASTSKYVGIYSSEAPESADPSAPAGPAFSVSLGKDGSATVTQDAYAAPAPQGLPRPYFLVERQVEGQATEERVIGARRLALEGAYNFRDLGGIKTVDGKWIRWGQIFRSDGLSKLTPADYSRLNAIGISLVCDLRTRDERKTPGRAAIVPPFLYSACARKTPTRFKESAAPSSP